VFDLKDNDRYTLKITPVFNTFKINLNTFETINRRKYTILILIGFVFYYLESITNHQLKDGTWNCLSRNGLKA
jgi:hypothetical protein